MTTTGRKFTSGEKVRMVLKMLKEEKLELTIYKGHCSIQLCLIITTE